jgi:hypothetical protein
MKKLHLAPHRGLPALGMLSALLIAVPAQAAPIEGWQVNPTTGQLTFILPDGVEPRYFLMAQPARIVVDLPDTELGDLPKEQTSTGPVKKITLEQIQPKLLRATLEIASTASFARGQVRLENNGDGTSGLNTRWTVTPLLAGIVPASNVAQNPTQNPTSTPIPNKPIAPAPQLDRAKPEAMKPKVAKPEVVKPEPIKPELPKPEATKPIASAPKTPLPVEYPPGMEPTAPNVMPIVPTKPASPEIQSPLVKSPLVKSPLVKSPLNPLPPAVAPVPALEPARPSVPPVALQPGVVGQPDVPLMQLPMSLPSASVPALPNQSSVSVPPLASISAVSVPSMTVPNPQGGIAPPAPSVPLAQLPDRTGTTQTIDRPRPALPDRTGSPTAIAMNVPALPDRPRAAAVPTAFDFGSAGQLFPTTSYPGAPSAIYPQTGYPQTGYPQAGYPQAGYPQTTSIYGTQAPTQPRNQPIAAPQVVSFGQPLPTNGSPAGVSSNAVVALDNLTTGGIVVPVGTALNLMYGGNQPLKLVSGPARQEILVLQTAIRDRLGKTIVPAGSAVLGQFETDGSGSRFVAQVLSIPGRSLPLSAQSQALESKRQLSQDGILKNSGIGAVAGAILGGFAGGNVIGGAAAGAAISYAIAPKNTLVQPGQMVEIRLTQDLLAAR